MKIRVIAIGSVAADRANKFTDHALNPDCPAGLACQAPEFFKKVFHLVRVRGFECFINEVVEMATDGSAHETVFSARLSASQLGEQVEMTELHNPMAVMDDCFHAMEIIDDNGTNT